MDKVSHQNFNGLGHNKQTHIYLSRILDLSKFYHQNNILLYLSNQSSYNPKYTTNHLNTQVLLQQLAAMMEEFLYALFMNLHKAYEALERDRCLEIPEGYGVVTQACHILRK